MNITIKYKSLLFALLTFTFSNNAFSQLITFDFNEFTTANDTINKTYDTEWGDLLLSVQLSSNSSFYYEYSNSRGDFSLVKAAGLDLSFDLSGLTDAAVENVEITFGHVDHNYNYFMFTQTPDSVDNQGLIYYDNAAAHPYSLDLYLDYADSTRIGGYQCGDPCDAPSVLWEKLLDNNEINIQSHGTVAFGNITFDVNESPSQVPVPATIWLLGSAFLVLVRYRRKK